MKKQEFINKLKELAITYDIDYHNVVVDNVLLINPIIKISVKFIKRKIDKLNIEIRKYGYEVTHKSVPFEEGLKLVEFWVCDVNQYGKNKKDPIPTL